MADRVRELLAFDRTLLEAILEQRPHCDPEDGEIDLPNLCGTTGPIRLVGFDEAGRGALAGPVAVACVRVDFDHAVGGCSDDLVKVLAGLDDSKRLTPRRREALYQAILSVADYGFGCASAPEIDRLGIVHACRIAARRAYEKLSTCATVALLDRGLSVASGRVREVPPSISLTRGDGRSLHIAAASILAKVGRDTIMSQLDRRVPGYGLSRHKGYGTAAHREAIERHGVSAVHRRSFCSRIETAESQSC